MKPQRVAVYLKVFARVYVRNRVGLFFALIFPIILILLFGAIFSNTGSSTVNLYVQDQDHGSAASEAFLSGLNQTGVLSISLVPASAGNLSAWLVANGDTAGLVIPDGFGSAYAAHQSVNVTIYTDPAQAASAGIVEGAVQGVVNGFNLQAAGGAPVVGVQGLNVGGQTYSYVDYLIPGLIGFAILVSPMFAVVNLSSQVQTPQAVPAALPHPADPGGVASRVDPLVHRARVRVHPDHARDRALGLRDQCVAHVAHPAVPDLGPGDVRLARSTARHRVEDPRERVGLPDPGNSMALLLLLVQWPCYWCLAQHIAQSTRDSQGKLGRSNPSPDQQMTIRKP